MTDVCTHFDQIAVRNSDTRECAECIQMGDRWFHLRLCLYCGYVGCCDTSKNKHTTAHVNSTGHQVVRSLEAGEAWTYCYADDLFVEEFPGVEPA